MKIELDRLKSDLETIQKAMGVSPSLGRDWLEWLKRDKWFSLWWCVPGLILIASALAPLDLTRKYAGLVLDQWAGLLVALTMLVIAYVHGRRVAGRNGRSDAAVREGRRINGMDRQGFVFGLASLIQVVVYGFWSWQHHIAFETLWTGMFIVMGSTYLIVALAARAWTLLGWALPFLAYGLCLPLAGGTGKVVLFGLMFMAVALSFSLIQVLQIRKFEREHVAH
jgi:hypothetical protein